MKYNIVFNDNRPITVAMENFPQDNGVLIEVPDGFVLSNAEDWIYQNGELVYSPLKTEEEKILEQEMHRQERERFERNEVAKLEIQTALIMAQINTLDVDDATALRWMDFYPVWEIGKVYDVVGYKFRYNDNLYKVRTPHTSQESWLPDSGTESLYQRIDETHAGTLEDPIPYDGNMVLESGKYYSQNKITYLCTTNTVNAVYHALSDLVGLYVSVVE